MLGWYFQTGHTWDWLGTEVFKSSLLSPHRHREDLHARFYLSSQILKRFSFPQALSVLVEGNTQTRDHGKAEKRMLQK